MRKRLDLRREPSVATDRDARSGDGSPDRGVAEMDVPDLRGPRTASSAWPTRDRGASRPLGDEPPVRRLSAARSSTESADDLRRMKLRFGSRGSSGAELRDSASCTDRRRGASGDASADASFAAWPGWTQTEFRNGARPFAAGAMPGSARSGDASPRCRAASPASSWD